MAKTVKVHGQELNLKVIDEKNQQNAEILIKNSKVDFNAQPEKVGELLSALGIAEDVTVEVRVTTASTIVE